MLRIAHAQLRPQHRPSRVLPNPPSQTVPNRYSRGLEPSSMLSWLLCVLLRATIRTLSQKSANRCSHA